MTDEDVISASQLAGRAAHSHREHVLMSTEYSVSHITPVMGKSQSQLGFKS